MRSTKFVKGQGLKRSTTMANGVARKWQIAAAIMLGTACALIAMQERAARREALLSEFRPYTGGQQLFTIEDFDSGRVSFPDAGMRGVNQVVKSNDENIGMPDHKWEHQTRVNEAPMQEWPMTTAGMKTKTSQLVSRQGLKRLSQVDQQELKVGKPCIPTARVPLSRGVLVALTTFAVRTKTGGEVSGQRGHAAPQGRWQHPAAVRH